MHETAREIGVPRDLEGLIASGSLTGLSEADLLERFTQRRDPRALEMIVGLHGAMVLAVCRQLLADPNDVDDAFQATFLVLIRKGSSIRRPGSLGSWLYGVAYRTARRIRDAPRPPRLVVEPAGEQPAGELDRIELFEALHREVRRLPEKYRQPVVLCYFEGMTHDAAAARLSWPVGTVRGRLARARDRLRKRLATRGVGQRAGFIGLMERAGTHGASLPVPRTQAILRLLEHAASPRVISLTQGVLAAMLTEKLKWAAVAVVAPSIVVFAAGTALVAGAGGGQQGNDQPPTPVVGAVKDEQRKDAAEKAEKAERKEADLEARANSLESDKVSAELLEIETNAIRSAIQQLMQQMIQPGFGSFAGRDGIDQRLREQFERAEKSLRQKIAELRATYLEKRQELARLNRAIAHESKQLGVEEIEPSTLSELSQRLESLESKVDRILEAESKGRK